MVAPVALRVDQKSVILLPGEAAVTSDVKNSMRGAFGLMTRVGVGKMLAGVRVGPNSDVGDGPPVGDAAPAVGVSVGEAAPPGVREAVGVKVSVIVGGSVGITCIAVAPQPLMIAAKSKKKVNRTQARICIMGFLTAPIVPLIDIRYRTLT